MNEEMLESLRQALQKATDSGRFAVSVIHCDGDKVEQFFIANEFPHAKAGHAARLLIDAILPKCGG